MTDELKAAIEKHVAGLPKDAKERPSFEAMFSAFREAWLKRTAVKATEPKGK